MARPTFAALCIVLTLFLFSGYGSAQTTGDVARLEVSGSTEWATGGGTLIRFVHSAPETPTRGNRDSDSDAIGSGEQERLSDVPVGAQVEVSQNTKRREPSNWQSSAAEAGVPEVSAEAGVPEVLVKGARVLNMDIRRTEDDIQPYVVLDRGTLENSGAVNLEELFKGQVTMNVSSLSANQRVNGGTRSSINLRGLGSDETLILIDGHRVAGFNFDGTPEQPDVNAIPLAAIERVEILPTTASGIYGGGATGGVINIILRRDYSGVETKLTYGNTFASDAAARRLDLNAGFHLNDGNTNVLLAGSYADANPLLVGERNFVQRGRQHILANNPTFYLSAPNPPRGETTNIRSNVVVNGIRENLTLDDGTPLNSTITFIPKGYAGAITDGGVALVSNAGRYNLALPETAQFDGAKHGLLSTPEIKSLMATLRHRFTPQIDAFVEFHSLSSRSEFAFGPGFPSLIIPADAPNNPFQQSIRVSIPGVGLDSRHAAQSDNRRAVAGVIAQLPREWRGSIDVTWNRSRSSYSSIYGVNTASVAAINSGSIDVLRDLNEFPVEFRINELPDQSATPAKSTLEDATLRIAGPLHWHLPAGQIVLSAALEHRRESLDQVILSSISSGQSLVPDRSQSVDSAYLEAKLPIVGARNAKPAIKLLDLQVSVRRDAYEVKGATSRINLANPQPIVRAHNKNSSVDPTIGLKYSPSLDVTFRTSYGTGYLPPSVSQLVSTPTTFNLSNLTDPLRNNEPLSASISYLFGGNPDLQPESSESWSAGTILTPRWMSGLRLSLDWSWIQKSDNITSLDLAATQARLNDTLALFPDRVTRGAPSDGFSVGPITAIDSSLMNIARLRVEALDIAADYEIETERFGEIAFALGATRLLSLQTQLTSTTSTVENVGVLSRFDTAVGGLKWNANSLVRWAFRGFSLGWRTRFFDSYFLNVNHTVDANQGSAEVHSQIYHDLFGSYSFGSLPGFLSGALSDTDIHFGVNNVFSKEPPVDVFFASSGSYYSSLGDPRLANYYISIRKGFGVR